jgi:hypothetical protein
MQSYCAQYVAWLACRLNKEPLKWGSSEDEGGPVFYVMRPTWAHARAEVPEQLAGPVPVWTEPPHVSLGWHHFKCVQLFCLDCFA